MKDEEKKDCCDGGRWSYHHHGGGHHSGGQFYGLGVIGAAVYFVNQVSGFWSVVLAVLKAVVWPAFLVYKAFMLMHM